MEYVLSYELGYGESSYAPILYKQILEVCSTVLFFSLALIWLNSLLRRRSWNYSTLSISLILIFICASWFLLPSSRMVLWGLKNRVIRDQSLNDIRGFARDVDQIKDAYKPHTDSDEKLLMSEDISKTGLKAKYPFLRWIRGHSFDGPSFVKEENRVVDVQWGSAYSGHWGFKIRVDGKRIDLLSSPGTSLRLSDDVIIISDFD